MNNDLMFGSNNQAWATRWDDFNKWNKRFGFTLDVCATKNDAKCGKYYTPEKDGLKSNWHGETFWCNPPYGREYPAWVRKAFSWDKSISSKPPSGVILIPARTDTAIFHDVLLPRQEDGHCSIEFIRGRITFGSDQYWQWVWEQEFINGKKNSLHGKHGKMNPAPFPSMLVKIGDCKWL